MANNINANQRIDAISVSGKIHTIAPFHGTAAEWDNNPLYIPAQGEIVIYDIDDNNDKSKFKIGDGETTVANLPFFTCDNGGDEKEIYGVDVNKDGNVELIFGAKPLPTFSIRHANSEGIFIEKNPYLFEFELGMTWKEWAYSEYCLLDFNKDTGMGDALQIDDYSISIYWYGIYTSDGNYVSPSDLIVQNEVYYTSY